jgi:hypothetical protein
MIFGVTLALASILGCDATLAQEGSGGAPENKVIGVWQGTTLAACSAMLPTDRCNAEQNVSITVLEGPDGKPTGHYKCWFGTEDCLQGNDGGKVIEASLTGGQISIRVLTRDGLTYMFSGLVTNDSVNGVYTCTSGGGVLERGRWQARRTY